jgi:hypothetical protein
MTQWKWYRWDSRQTANTSQRHSKNRQRMAHKLRTNWHYNLVACESPKSPLHLMTDRSNSILKLFGVAIRFSRKAKLVRKRP